MSPKPNVPDSQQPSEDPDGVASAPPSTVVPPMHPAGTAVPLPDGAPPLPPPPPSGFQHYAPQSSQPQGQPSFGPPPHGSPLNYGPPGATPQQAWVPGVLTKKTDGMAIAVLVLGISSYSMLPLVGAIIALCLAPNARRNIEAGNGWVDGETPLQIGVVLSWVNIALSGALLILVVLLVVIGVVFGST